MTALIHMVPDMIHFSDKNTVIQAYKEIGRPLEKDVLDNLESVDAELTTLGEKHEFVIFQVKCRICNYVCNVIAPAIAPLDDLECPNCENRACQENEPNEWEAEE